MKPINALLSRAHARNGMAPTWAHLNENIINTHEADAHAQNAHDEIWIITIDQINNGPGQRLVRVGVVRS